MPKSHILIPAPLRGALIECYRAATRLVRPDRRRQLVLVGGAASTAHSSDLYTEDVDVAAPPAILIELWEAVEAGAPNFNLEPDGKIAFDSSLGIHVQMELIQIGGDFIKRIHVAEPFHEGAVASKSDLFRLRALTVVDGGGDEDCGDFRWLLSEMAKAGQLLPGLNKEELDAVTKVGVSCLGVLDCLVLFALLNISLRLKKKKKKK